ncbi:MAG TPA: nuclear transport factor 2 family protein [Pseudomonadales bacterium]
MSSDAAFARDRLEITNLIHSYAHHADAGDLDAFLDLFAEDAAVDIGIPGVRDKASLSRAMRARPPAADMKSRHVMTNLMFREQNADSATGSLYFTLMSSAAGKVAPAATGQYTFTVGRADGRWRIRRWRAEVDGAGPGATGEAAQ